MPNDELGLFLEKKFLFCGGGNLMAILGIGSCDAPSKSNKIFCEKSQHFYRKLLTETQNIPNCIEIIKQYKIVCMYVCMYVFYYELLSINTF